MSTLGFTYGSEWHLLRYLGYHRNELERRIKDLIPSSRILGWLDLAFEYNARWINQSPVICLDGRLEGRFLDLENTGIGFFPAAQRENLQLAWEQFWPHTGELPNWDAVGLIEVGGVPNWIIVEAKSHLRELRSTCGAAGAEAGGGMDQILAAFEATQAAWPVRLGPHAWMGPYYQFYNRLAFLHFLREQNGIPARLLFVYFLGDKFPEGRAEVCPETEEEWQPALEEIERTIGWTAGNPLADHVHKLFLPVCP